MVMKLVCYTIVHRGILVYTTPYLYITHCTFLKCIEKFQTPIWNYRPVFNAAEQIKPVILLNKCAGNLSIYTQNAHK